MASFTIVSFCGGGVRGLLSARILARLARKHPYILTTTSLYAGTSTGSGIIGQLLAGKSPDEICDYFTIQERKFYAKPASTRAHEPRYLVDEVALGNVEIVGERKLKDFSQKVLFTAFFVGGTEPNKAIQPWAPRLYTNLPRSGTPDVRAADAITQSSAMPGMMGSWQRCIDGAFVNHDPSIAAIALAIENGAALEDIAVINIGTGLMPDWITDDTKQWGAAQWFGGGPDGNAGNQTPPFFLNWPAPTPALDIALNGTSANLTPMLVEKLVGKERYANLNPQLNWYVPEDATSDKDLGELEAKAMTCDLSHADEILARAWSRAR